VAEAAFMIASTVLGYLVGLTLPVGLKRVVHPIIGCALLANAGAAVWGLVTGKGYEEVLKSYITKVMGQGSGLGFVVAEERALVLALWWRKKGPIAEMKTIRVGPI
jgi:Na+/citrate or Na+/malate symporter